MPDPARIAPQPPPESDHSESEPNVHLESGSRISLTTPDPSRSADYNLRVVATLVRWLSETQEASTFDRIASSIGVDTESLRRVAGWLSWRQCEAFLAQIRGLAGSDEAFDQACVYRVAESWGSFRYIAWALTPMAMYKGAPRANKTLSTVGEFKVREAGARRVLVTYTTSKPESRLLCATRLHGLESLPTCFNLAPAHVHHPKCVARGDAACVYEITWAAQKRWLPVAIGLALGVVASMLLRSSALGEAVALFLPPLFGALSGYLFERNKHDHAILIETDAANVALQKLMADEAEARREMVALNERQREWERLVEAAHAERVEGIQDVITRAERMKEQRETTLLGFSHDLRNPLMVLASTVQFLRESEAALGDEAPEIIADVETSIEQMKHMLGDFVAAATDQDLVKLSPKRLETSALTTSLTRRLRALVQGRPIVPSVMQTREAPDAIMLDPIVFDRVTDNLLTNAVKYTDRGSIVVEVSGSPRAVVVKISDSGRGIAEEDLVRIFTAGGSRTAARARDSYGVGLSVILQLLEQIGGLLEVQSTPGKGTTFWAHFPTGLEPSTSEPPLDTDSSAQMIVKDPLSSRVRIRKPSA